MSEEMNDGTWSGLRKTIVGTLSTVVAGGGTWLGVTLFGGGDEEPKEETKTEQAAPAAPVVVNVQQNQENKQKVENNPSTRTVIYENHPPKTEVEQPVKPKKVEEESW
jgi:pullulanase/glycogen debranching enzyme